MHTERARTYHHEEVGDWISLQQASDLLGVAVSTLRRWGDSGHVPMKRTLGGHRRFQRAAIERLASGQTADTSLAHAAAPQPGWSFDTRDLARQEWHTHFTTGPLTDRMRGLGQRLLGLLIQYINRR